jgi:hypothetical protein
MFRKPNIKRKKFQKKRKKETRAKARLSFPPEGVAWLMG